MGQTTPRVSVTDGPRGGAPGRVWGLWGAQDEERARKRQTEGAKCKPKDYKLPWFWI